MPNRKTRIAVYKLQQALDNARNFFEDYLPFERLQALQEQDRASSKHRTDPLKIKKNAFAEDCGLIGKDQDIAWRGGEKYKHTIPNSCYVTRLPDTQLYFGPAPIKSKLNNEDILQTLLDENIYETLCLVPETEKIMPRYYQGGKAAGNHLILQEPANTLENTPFKKMKVLRTMWPNYKIHRLEINSSKPLDRLFCVHHCPIEDGSAAQWNKADYEKIFELLNRALLQAPLFVHCLEGKGRTGLVVLTALLMRNYYERFIRIFYTPMSSKNTLNERDRARIIRELRGLISDLRELSPGLVASPEQLWQVFNEILITHFVPWAVKDAQPNIETLLSNSFFSTKNQDAEIFNTIKLIHTLKIAGGACEILYDLQQDIFRNFKFSNTAGDNSNKWQLIDLEQPKASCELAALPQSIAEILILIEEAHLEEFIQPTSENAIKVTAQAEEVAHKTLIPIWALLKEAASLHKEMSRHVQSIENYLKKSEQHSLLFENSSFNLVS